MNILNKILADKVGEIEIRKSVVSKSLIVEMLGDYSAKEKRCSMSHSIKKSKYGIISEFKRSSPSKGVIKENANVEEIIPLYEKLGASGISVLTDKKYFGGSLKDLENVRKITDLPVLRKDFVIDEYQIFEAALAQADTILLIAAALEKNKLKDLAFLAHSLKLEVLLEVHNEKELDHFCDYVDIIGVNNRDLTTFRTDIKQSVDLFDKLPNDVVKISESGISSWEDMEMLKNVGYDGFLVGENLMNGNLIR
ncbi:MAG: indole-3-glycerol phosphate synthase TrpC [Bacteroidales bacterium]|nr:indole-3-glycerol phosphate synthase TrpC [Bacteroidales bacterium]